MIFGVQFGKGAFHIVPVVAESHSFVLGDGGSNDGGVLHVDAYVFVAQFQMRQG